ncbi:protein PLANT CADMIUM RESISTANCE 12 [Carica papaya]|uniref:protein PLANT CADMIUM RESISTANCE 12 n=1 Tax=Carica papaya TaxID=3649 RepID=UPI000B8D124E|nr:protein PLANT CADMIUM RESISTANCE 12 [Carica papaya]
MCANKHGANQPIFTPASPTLQDQPYAKQLPQGLWTTGLCDCCDDPFICLQASVCPCITFGQNSEIINRGTTTCLRSTMIHIAMGVVLCGWLYGCANRSRLREHFALPEEPCPDYCTHIFCLPWALSQEHRELKNRDADPSLGWQGNVEKWSKEKTTPPIVVPGMTR